MTSLQLHRQFRQVLIDLQLVSYAPATNWNPSTPTHNKPLGGNHPPGEPNPPADLYSAMWAEALDDDHRHKILAAAQAELQHLRKRPAATHSTLTDSQILTERILREGNGWTPEELARTLRCTVGHVRRTRQHNGRHSETGQTLESLTTTERQHLAHDLAAQGLTQQQIAFRMNLNQSTVSRLLRFRTAA